MNGRTSLGMLALFALAACALSSCGSSASNFIGTWQLAGGTLTTTCNAVSTSSNVTGNITIAAAATGGNVVSTDADGCNIQWAPNGDVATLVAGQTCSSTDNGVTTVLSFTTGTLTVTNGTSLAVAATGNGTANGDTCTFSETATATLVAH
jgi:hypothetical protein